MKQSEESAFALWVMLKIEELRTTDRELAIAFDMSMPSAQRWREGRCGVHPAMRTHIINWFNERAAQ